MASFQAKIVWKKMRKRETKIIVPFCYVPARCVIENSIKIVKYSKKKRKEYDNVHFKPKQFGKGRIIWKIKIIVSYRSYQTRRTKFQKKLKKVKNTIVDSFQAKID